MAARILIFSASKDSATSQPRAPVKYRTAHTTEQPTLSTSQHLCKHPFAVSKGPQGTVAVWQERRYLKERKKTYLCYQTTETMALKDLNFLQEYYSKGRDRQEPWCQPGKLSYSPDNLPVLLSQAEVEKRQEWTQEKRHGGAHNGWGCALSRTA